MHAYACMEELRQACHDSRQPTAGILALASAALAEANLSENARNCLDQIVRLADLQSGVVEHWLEATADRPADARHTDVVAVVNEAIAAERLTWAGELTQGCS